MSNNLITLPPSDFGLLLRTDFSDDSVWEIFCKQIEDNPLGIPATITILNDKKYAGLALEQLPKFRLLQTAQAFVMLADKTCMMNSEHPALCVDLNTEYLRTFRIIPAEIAAIAANLGLANMDFFEIADYVDADGVFRGFKE